jgi:hypothetical protein
MGDSDAWQGQKHVALAAAQNSSIASYGLGSAVSTLLYGVTATDGATLIAVGVDPMVALRQE